MNIRRAISTLLIALFVVLFALPGTGARAAAKLQDGVYTLNYLVKQAENDSVSMANDYFEKPAKVVVTNGEANVQLQMNHSKWITMFKPASNGGYADAAVISTDAAEDTRVVSFKAEDLSQPVNVKIHVTVESIAYDHDYTIRLVFDEKSIKSAGSSEAAPAKAAEKAPAAEAKGASPTGAASGASKEEPAPKRSASAAEKAPSAGSQAGSSASKSAAVNPQTGDSAPVAMLIILLAVSGSFLFYRYKEKLKS